MEPSLTRAQLRAFDREAIEELGIPGAVLMENAGRSAARELCEYAGTPPPAHRAVILCGGGNNGGDGYVLARHLDLAGWTVELFCSKPAAELEGDAAIHRRIVDGLGLPVYTIESAEEIAGEVTRWKGADVLVDALLGTGAEGLVRPPMDAWITASHAAKVKRRVALDLPSGLDADTGAPSNATFRADLTVTFLARKRGFDAPRASRWTGRVVVAGIGVPLDWRERREA